MPSSSRLLTRRRRPINRVRILRAIMRDSRALLHEFRWSIIGFLLVVMVGGFIYGELYFLARGESIPHIDRPYFIIQLMFFAADGVPAEWYLVIFWYAMPVILLLIVGRGAADFLQLFFNRDERRDAWREALASTYRHHIIILGAGHVGLRVIRALHDMGVDVVVIDHQAKPGVDEALRAMKIPVIMTDARLPSTLEKAGLRDADAIVICTGDDHTNMDVVMRVRDMNPQIRVVVRMWEDQFARQIERYMNVQSVLSSSELSAPVFAGAALGVDITQTLQIKGVDYSLIRLKVQQGSFLANQPLGKLQDDHDMDIVLHERDDSVEVEPHSDTMIAAGDYLVIFARHERILELVAQNRRAAS